MSEVKYPDVEVELSNLDLIRPISYALITRVARALDSAGYHEAAFTFKNRAYEQISFEGVLQLAKKTVSVY